MVFIRSTHKPQLADKLINGQFHFIIGSLESSSLLMNILPPVHD